MVVDVTGTVILIGDAAKLLTVVEFVFRNTAATNTFVVIFDGFVCAMSIVGEVAGDVPVLAEDALIGDIARKKSSVVVILVVVCRIGTMPDVVAGMAGGAVFVVDKMLVVSS